MDLKFKGKTWVGNIYHKFEAMCYEVDDFVSQDTVKYVENQVQAAGRSVKFFCSDVVQDLIPPYSGDPVNHEAQTAHRKQNDTVGTYTRSMIGIEEKPVDIDIKQSSVEQEPIDPQENYHTSPFTVNQFIPPPTEDPIKETESDLSLGKDGDALIYQNADMGVEGNGNSDMGVEENVSTEEQSPLEDLSSSEDKNYFEESLVSESIDENHNNGILDKVSPATFVNSVGIISSPKKGTLFNSFLNEVDCVSNIPSSLRYSEPPFSILPTENKVAETALISSSNSVSTKSYSLSEFAHATFPQKAEKMFYDPTDSVSCVSDISGALSCSESFPTVACDSKGMEMGLVFSSSVLSMESNDADTARTYQAVSVTGSSGHEREQCCKSDQLEDFMSSLEIGQVEGSSSGIAIADPSMETIDLSDKVTLNQSCGIMDSKSLYALSCSAIKLRSYKKIIQDAFASRKRLTKEYEQLGIWYGDIDIIESSHHPKETMLPSIDTMSLEAKKSGSQDLDSEWELL